MFSLYSAAEALEGLSCGNTILVGGFGDSGIPHTLLDAVLDNGARDLTVVSINAGRGDAGIARLISEERVSKIICAFPRTEGSIAFERAWSAGRIELESVPMGTLVERIRSKGAGIPAFYTRVSAGTLAAQGKEERAFDDAAHVLEFAIGGDFALLHAQEADRFGNLRYRGTARNLNPVIAKAARVVVAQITALREQPLDPEQIVSPGIFIDRLVLLEQPS